MLPSLTDNPTTRIDDDAFGFRTYIEELHDAVGRASSLPITVGVFGPWGSGKTSFLKMWEDLLSFAPSTRTLWFNPWKYDQKIEVWAALIQSLLAEIRAVAEQPLRDKAGRLARTAAWLGLRGAAGAAGGMLSGATGGLVDKALFESFLDGVTENDAGYYRNLNRFELDFADAVEEYLGEEGRLVVFVDDLDRCGPDAALNVLEALKLFVGDARCVFVLALDYDLLTAVAGRKFAGIAPLGTVTGAAYLEKIIQVPFFLPEIGFDGLRASLAPHVGELGGSEAFWELARIAFGTNPRRVKRFINVLNLATAIAAREGWGGGQGLSVSQRLQFAELLILRGEHRSFFLELVGDPGLWLRAERSAALPPPGSGGPVSLAREPDPAIRELLGDVRLSRLLRTRPGAYHDHPPAPPADVVERMLRSVRVTAGFPPGEPG